MQRQLEIIIHLDLENMLELLLMKKQNKLKVLKL